MNDNSHMMLPEDALSRFSPDTDTLDAGITSNEYKQARYGFRISDIGFLISSETLCEVMKNFIVYPVPNTRKWMQGLVNLRGNLIPVYDMSLLLGLSNEPVGHENLLIMDKGSNSVGILIENLPQPFDTSKGAEISQIPELPAGLSNCISDAYTVDDVIWLGFKHKEFFQNVMGSVASN